MKNYLLEFAQKNPTKKESWSEIEHSRLSLEVAGFWFKNRERIQMLFSNVLLV
jgi:hypothetical protein